ncbi:MAG TPA: DUF4198 domain-containing protein, partial [Planctomycetota bacterium]|nr:DUF4198 domain-containing protein [Planctomycetota bacterium]
TTSDPVKDAIPRTPGTSVVWLETQPTRIELEAAKFEQYLKEDGLDAAAEARKRAGATGKPGRERYTRYAKSIFRVGLAAMGGVSATAPTGLALEFVPLADPCALRVGQRLDVRLLHRGAPLDGALVRAWRRPPGTGGAASQPAAFEGRASSGFVSIPITGTGAWLVSAVHMMPATGDVDWESSWASLTFVVSEAGR